MAGAQKVHLQARGKDRQGPYYLLLSVCGRYPKSGAVPIDVVRAHLRRRLTSAVTCRHCRSRWLKHGEATPPARREAAAA